MTPALLLLPIVALLFALLSETCPASYRSSTPLLAPKLKRVVIGYYPAWKRNEFSHQRVHFELLTYLAHAFTKPDALGNLIVPVDYLYPELLREAHRYGVKVLMSIGGWGNSEGFPGMASAPETRTRFVNQVVDFVRQHHYDGVDIDWEFVSTAEDQRNFTVLIKELSAALKSQSPPLVLTMAAPSGSYWGKWINYEEVAADFDYISAMTYDFHGPWSDHSGHNSPLYSCGGDVCGSFHDSHLYFLSRSVPREKLLLGLAFFGRSFDCPGLYQKFQTSTYYGYGEVIELLKSGWASLWDDCAKVPLAQSPDGKMLVSYDDEKSISLKCEYILDSGLAGVIIWEITQDDDSRGPVLLGAVGRAFQEPDKRKRDRRDKFTEERE